jgi:hypothetical protein
MQRGCWHHLLRVRPTQRLAGISAQPNRTGQSRARHAQLQPWRLEGALCIQAESGQLDKHLSTSLLLSTPRQQTKPHSQRQTSSSTAGDPAARLGAARPAPGTRAADGDGRQRMGRPGRAERRRGGAAGLVEALRLCGLPRLAARVTAAADALRRELAQRMHAPAPGPAQGRPAGLTTQGHYHVAMYSRLLVSSGGLAQRPLTMDDMLDPARPPAVLAVVDRALADALAAADGSRRQQEEEERSGRRAQRAATDSRAAAAGGAADGERGR